VWQGAAGAAWAVVGVEAEAEADLTAGRLEDDMVTVVGVVTARRGVESRVCTGCGVVSYGEQVGVGSRSSRRATVAAMNFGSCPRTKAMSMRFDR
jgi:hypothetical protein